MGRICVVEACGSEYYADWGLYFHRSNGVRVIFQVVQVVSNMGRQELFVVVGVWVIGVVLRVLNALLSAMFYVRACLSRAPRHLPPPRNPILLRSATDLADAIRRAELSSQEVVGAFIDRIREVNPYLNAVVEERFRDAMQEAFTLDQRLFEARWGGGEAMVLKDKPLYGLPFTVKESCSLAGLSNTVGCLEREGSRAASDGAAVRLVRSAGAVPLLVSATPELCLGWETTSLLNGRTNNPYDLSRTPGGSSGGEAALLASAASPISVSSDIAGSIRIPAAFCGLFGHKPTPGIIPIEGHIPTLADEQYPRFLTVGPMCRHAEDLPLLMKVMAGERQHLLNLDQPVDLSKIRVHYMTEASSSLALLPVHPDICEAVLNAANHLHHHCGAALSEKKFKALEDSVEMSISVFFSMKDIPNLLHDPANPKRDRSLVVEALKALVGAAARSLQALGFALLSRTKLFLTRARRLHYQHQAQLLQEEITSTLGDDGVLLYPAHCGPAHEHGLVFVRAAGVLYTMPLNVLALPATVLPLHRTHRRMPLALQVIAGPNQDRLCLAVARELELAFGGWQPPI